MNSIFTSSYRNIFLLGLIVFITTSIFSSGYFHPDEHFQILEFCSYKLGNSPASDLSWEFSDKIRPTLQPVLCLVFVKSMSIFGIQNPITQALILRLITSLLSWFLISKICLLLLNSFSSDKGKKYFLLLSFFLWFIPLLSVRFSSENYSALALLSAVCFILRYINQTAGRNFLNLVFAGLFLGFSFFLRFQIAFAILGLGFWLLFIQKINWKDLSVLILSGLFAIAISILVDCWYYGDLVLSPWNYFVANIVDDVAAGWGTSPWWDYFARFFVKSVPPISLVLLVLFFIGLYKNPKSIFTWVIIPFFIGHFAVAHKELRFLFPMAFCFVYLVAKGLDFFINKYKINAFWKSLGVFLIVVNTLLLIFVVFTPSQPVIKYYNYLYKLSSKQDVVLLCKERSAYELVGVNVNFYKPDKITCLVFKDESEISTYLDSNDQEVIYLLEKNFFDQGTYPGYTNETVFCTLPQWFTHLNFNNWINRSRIWKIQELKRIE